MPTKTSSGSYSDLIIPLSFIPKVYHLVTQTSSVKGHAYTQSSPISYPDTIICLSFILKPHQSVTQTQPYAYHAYSSLISQLLRPNHTIIIHTQASSVSYSELIIHLTCLLKPHPPTQASLVTQSLSNTMPT